MIKWYWVDTKWGCGGIKTENNIIVSGAPIFKKLIGKNINKIRKYYNVIELGSEG